MVDWVPFWYPVGFDCADNNGKYATLITGGLILLLGGALMVWMGWILAENRTTEGSLLFGIGLLGTMIGVFFVIVGLGGWISGTV